MSQEQQDDVRDECETRVAGIIECDRDCLDRLA